MADCTHNTEEKTAIHYLCLLCYEDLSNLSGSGKLQLINNTGYQGCRFSDMRSQILAFLSHDLHHLTVAYRFIGIAHEKGFLMGVNQLTYINFKFLKINEY